MDEARHALFRQLGEVRRAGRLGREGGRSGGLPEPRADDLETCRALPRTVEGQFRAEGHHASRRRDPCPFAGRRRPHGVQPRRAAARQCTVAARGAAGGQQRGRRQDDPDAGWRRAPRAGRADRGVHGRQVRVRRPADALWRDGGRHPGSHQGAADLPPRDRHQHGADGRPHDRRSRPAFPDVGGRGGSAPQPSLMVEVDFYLGLGSRYSYLAASQVDRIEKTHGCRFAWKPIASGALMDRRGGNPFRGEPVSGQYDWGYREYDAKCWASYYGIPFREPVAFRTDPARLALACLAADEQGALVPCCRLLQRLIFVDGVAIDDDVIGGLPATLGLDAAAYRKGLAATATRARHDALLDEARERGAFGVPTFFLDDRMFWGNDRLMLLEAALAGAAMPSWARPD